MAIARRRVIDDQIRQKRDHPFYGQAGGMFNNDYTEVMIDYEINGTVSNANTHISLGEIMGMNLVAKEYFEKNGAYWGEFSQDELD